MRTMLQMSLFLLQNLELEESSEEIDFGDVSHLKLFFLEPYCFIHLVENLHL